MEFFGRVIDGKIQITLLEKKLEQFEGNRVLVSVTSLDCPSTGQMNLLRFWLRIFSEEIGVPWRRIYAEATFPLKLEKEPQDLKKEEIEQVLRELERLASDMEILLPFPTEWDRKPKLYGIG